MFDPDSIPDVQRLIRQATSSDSRLLDGVLRDVAAIGPEVRVIQPRQSSAVSLVASDGGNNQLRFNPFTMQVIRVVDSHGVELFLDVVSPTTDTVELGERHLADPDSVLGVLMRDLGVSSLAELSPMIPPEPRFAGWPMVFRDLCEWAVLYWLVCYSNWGSTTLIVRDGLLRSRIFSGDLFHTMYTRMREAIARTRRKWKRDVFVVGIAKRSEVVERYRMAMSLANLFPTGHPYFAAIPYDLQRRVYQRADYIRPPTDPDAHDDRAHLDGPADRARLGDPQARTDGTADGAERPGDRTADGVAGGERPPAVARSAHAPTYNMGAMHLVRFGSESGDPVWTVDLLHDQRDRAQEVFGTLLYDAQSGFPVPYYPLCLQEADQHAHVADFDLEILQDSLVEAVREQVPPDRRHLFDAFNKLYVSDVAARRYR
ncbi:hypothetical protein ACFO4E_13230 [Nocardiopsis mangrovi]|uniref:NurA domain-containing protein n=1 Tax=Nocardiopsis mangrovi TaxID=1179818 RepID=A0ABV9DXQ6_9ACTN